MTGLCIVCEENPKFGPLRRCKPCLQKLGEAERATRESLRARREKYSPLFANIEAGGKVCRTCAGLKSIEEFSRDAVAADGRRRSCNGCIESGRCKPVVKSEEAKSKDYAKAKEPHRRAANLAAVKRWQTNNAEPLKAARTLRLAVAAGVVGRPERCQVAGCSCTDIGGHHHNYQLPLHVVWLCRSHHRDLHNGRPLQLIDGLPPELATVPPTLVSVTDAPGVASDNSG